MFKTFFRRLKLGLLPTLVISSIAVLIVSIIYLACISDIFAGIIGVLIFMFMIYTIGKERDKHK